MKVLKDQSKAAHAANQAIKEFSHLILNRNRPVIPNYVRTSLPYLRAIRENNYGLEDPAMCVLYALNNLTQWRGELARHVKVQLNDSLEEQT